MTEPKFPWALLVIIGMFGFVAASAEPPWIVAFAIVAVIVSVAAAIYQVIPRKDDSLTPADDVVDPWDDRDAS
jgi:hypothetical protein